MTDARRLRQRRKMQSVTMADVAGKAEVSPSTVSLYLRRPAEVSKKIAARIDAAIDELGYVPSFIAGGLASAGSRVVSIIVPSLKNAFFSAAVARMENLLGQAGYQTLVGSNEYVPEVEEQLVRASLSWSPAAIVLTGLGHSEATARLLRTRQAPVIEMFEVGQTPIRAAVGFSHSDVGRSLTALALARGRRRPVFVGARLDQDRRARQRAEGYRAEMQAAGLEPTVLELDGLASTAKGAEALGEVLTSHPEADALICSNDILALGVTFEAVRRRIPVPERLGLSGFGNLEFSETCNPPLTTIELNSDAIADTVVRLILDEIEKGETPEPQAVYDTGFSLIDRGSL